LNHLGGLFFHQILSTLLERKKERKRERQKEKKEKERKKERKRERKKEKYRRSSWEVAEESGKVSLGFDFKVPG